MDRQQSSSLLGNKKSAQNGEDKTIFSYENLHEQVRIDKIFT